MRGAAITFAREVRRRNLLSVDLIVATDMLDLATFLGLTRDLLGRSAVALYMHENQLTYPLPPGARAIWHSLDQLHLCAGSRCDLLQLGVSPRLVLRGVAGFARAIPRLPGA